MHTFSLQTGKLHFGVILGWSVVSSIVVWLVVNNMAGTENPESQSLGLYSCCCLLGYCLLPMVVFALLALVIPRYKLLSSIYTVLSGGCAHCISWRASYVPICAARYESYSFYIFTVTSIVCACALFCRAQAQINFHSCRATCRGIANVILASVTTLWCGRTAAKLFVKKAPSISDQTLLVAYPCTLMYSAFALLTVY